MTVMAKKPKSSNQHKQKSQKSKHFGKHGKKDFKSTGKRGRLIVRNLPFKCSEDQLFEHFKSFGEIKDIQLLRRPDNKLIGCGFVEFISRQNADKAREQLNSKQFLGRPIYIEKAVSRDQYDNSPNNDAKNLNGKNVEIKLGESEIKEEPMSEEDEDNAHDLDEDTEIKEEELISGDANIEKNATTNREERLTTLERDGKKSKNMKKARLIIRNLSFKSTEEKLKAHFTQFGEVSEVKLLRRADNTLVGCGFVQFSKKLSAAKAIHHASGKPFLGRPIIVDWAVGKDRFKQMQLESTNKEIKEEVETDEETKPIDVSNIPVKKEDESDQESEEESEEESESEKEDDDDDEDESEDEEVEQTVKQEDEKAKSQRKEDVDEGKTVFIRNLPFSVTNEEFKECMEQFGPVFYALICVDKLTEHSKGSGFVKFKNKEDAEKCLSAGTELTLKETILDPHPALKRNEAQKLKDKTKEKKDNRNLYLVKEGMIIAGTPAAQGVSVNDMEHRLQLEQWKTTKLRNLNMFVSRNRLVVHNLPQTINDKQLRKLFRKHAGAKSVITEARVMRDLKRVDTKGVGVSKSYGFISFEAHEDALRALRSINNNPTIFSPAARPIVSFSIENRTVLNKKKQRMLHSRQKNPLCKDYKPAEGDEVPKKKSKIVSRKEDESEPEYAGIVAKPGATVKMRQKYKLQNQAQQHVQDVKKQKREMKLSRQMRRTEHIKNKKIEKKSKTKKPVVGDDSAFTKLVDKYKTKLLSQPNDKKKWYD